MKATTYYEKVFAATVDYLDSLIMECRDIPEEGDALDFIARLGDEDPGWATQLHVGVTAEHLAAMAKTRDEAFARYAC